MKFSKVNMRHFVKVELGTYYAEVETENVFWGENVYFDVADKYSSRNLSVFTILKTESTMAAKSLLLPEKKKASPTVKENLSSFLSISGHLESGPPSR